MPQTKVDETRSHIGKSVGRVPNPHTRRELVGLVPQSRDSHESRGDGRLGQAEEDSLNEESGVVVTDDGQQANDTPDEDADCAGLGERVARKDQGPG
jgi:hypothetical protein